MLIMNSKPQLNENQINDLEKKFNICLPNEYRNFLLKYNGGIPRPSVFNFKDNGGQETNSLVHYFYAIYNESNYDNLEQNYILYIKEKRIPLNILPIADDPFGNMICISLSGNDCGNVYFWNHEEEVENESYDNLSLIANNFNEFLDNLYEV
jgi:cell wall assembly regulator SMI1